MPASWPDPAYGNQGGRYTLSVFALPGKFHEGSAPTQPWSPAARRDPSHVKDAVMLLRDPQGRVVQAYHMASGGLRTGVGGWNALPGLVHGGPPYGIDWKSFRSHGGGAFGYRDGKPGSKGEQGFWLCLINSRQADAEKGSAFGIHPTRMDASMGCINFHTGDEGRDFYTRMMALPPELRPDKLFILPPQDYKPGQTPSNDRMVTSQPRQQTISSPGWKVRLSPPA